MHICDGLCLYMTSVMTAIKFLTFSSFIESTKVIKNVSALYFIFFASFSAYHASYSISTLNLIFGELNGLRKVCRKSYGFFGPLNLDLNSCPRYAPSLIDFLIGGIARTFSIARMGEKGKRNMSENQTVLPRETDRKSVEQSREGEFFPVLASVVREKRSSIVPRHCGFLMEV